VPGEFNTLLRFMRQYASISEEVDPEDEQLLARYGWTPIVRLAVLHELLPEEFVHGPGEFPTAIYWAYGNELNKDIGMDLTPYLGWGEVVTVHLYKIAEHLPEFLGPLRQNGRAVVVRCNGDIVGAWLDGGRHQGFAWSLRGRSLEEVTGKDWSQWIAGLIDPEDPLEQELNRLSPEEIIRRYYAAVDAGDERGAYACLTRGNLVRYLFRNMGDRMLYNQGYPRGIMGLDNIISARVRGIKRYHSPGNDSKDDEQVYEVDLDLERKADCTGYGSYVKLRRETPDTGWRIEGIVSGP